MIQIRPFRGLRPAREMVSEVASLPYDVINSEEAREKVKGHPHSFLHVVKPEIDLDPSIDPHDTQVYKQGAKALRQLMSEHILIQDDKPCFYIYKLRMGDHEQTGLVAVASNEDYLNNKIKKHENTRIDKEADRANHMDILNAQPGPVFLTYRYQDEIDKLIKAGMEKPPIYDFIADYDIQHTFYIVDDQELILKIQSEFHKLDALYVADGHHRSAAAARIYQKRRDNNPDHTGDEPYNFYLTVIFPDAQMQILDYNRVVKDLNGHTNDEFFEKIRANFEVTPYKAPDNSDDAAYHPDQVHSFGMYLDKQWYILKAMERGYDPDDPISVLDVSILQENILSPILGIQDPRTDNRIHFVGGIRGLGELERLVDSGEYKVAFSMFPTTIQQLMDVADAGKVMPPKSTWFEPKLRSGLVVHLLD